MKGIVLAIGKQKEIYKEYAGKCDRKESSPASRLHTLDP